MISGGLIFFSGYFHIAKKRLYPKESKLYLLFTIVLVSLLLWHQPITIFLQLAIIAILGLLYHFPFANTSIREIPFLKAFWIAFLWSITLHVLSGNLSVHLFFGLYFQIFAISILFDLQDINKDRYPTFPNYFGIYITKYLSIISIGLSLFFFFCFFNNLFFNSYLLGLLLQLIVVTFLDKNSRFTYYFYVLEFANVFGIISLFCVQFYVNL